jgi:hypothetical protein
VTNSTVIGVGSVGLAARRVLGNTHPVGRVEAGHTCGASFSGDIIDITVGSIDQITFPGTFLIARSATIGLALVSIWIERGTVGHGVWLTVVCVEEEPTFASCASIGGYASCGRSTASCTVGLAKIIAVFKETKGAINASVQTRVWSLAAQQVMFSTRGG